MLRKWSSVSILTNVYLIFAKDRINPPMTPLVHSGVRVETGIIIAIRLKSVKNIQKIT